MSTLTTLFQTILNMSLAASIVAVVVMIVRLLFKKAPKIFSYVLWTFVLIRLVLPFSFASQVSVLTVANPSISERGGVQFVVPSVNQPVSAVPRPVIKTGDPAVNLPQTEINADAGISDSRKPIPSGPALLQSGAEASALSSTAPIPLILQVGSVIWVIGMIAYVGLLIANSLMLRHRLRYAMRVRQNIYECEAISSPFIYGLIHPKIYLPMDLDSRQRKYVLTHERVHLRRHDYVFKVIGSLLLMFHWFNPLLWYAYILMSKDMEMACDEAVLSRLGSSGRVNYGMTLLQFASKPTITALSFSESNTKLRIKNVLNYKKPTFWGLVAGIAACLLLAVPLLSNPAFGKDQREINALLKEAEDAHIENSLMTVNLNEPYNQYQWSIIPMMDQDLVIVIGEQNLERKITVAYNFKNAEVKAAVLESLAWGAEQCAGLGDLFYHLYVDDFVIPKALNNIKQALGDHLTSISYCTVFEPLGPISLSYGSNSDQLIVQFTKMNEPSSSQLVYDKNSGRYFLNSAAEQLALPESFWDEFVDHILLYDQQEVVQNSTCAVLEDGRFSCPESFAALPLGAQQVAPLVAWNGTPEFSEDYGVVGWDLIDEQTEDRTRIPVLAMAEGTIRELGEDEQGRRYLVVDHPSLGISAFYGGLNDRIYRTEGEEIYDPGQLLGYLSTDNLPKDQRPALHFALMAGGEMLGDLTPYLQYAMASPVKTNVFEILDLTFEIDEEKLALMDAIVAESDAYSEYAGRQAVVERFYPQQKGISLTAQANDFPTLNISQEIGTNKLYIDRSYLLNETVHDVIPGIDGNFLINVTLDRSPMMGNHTDYECSAYFPELQIWLNTTYDPSTGQYSTTDVSMEDEALMEATYAVFDEMNGRILRTDERALNLALQLIQVMTDEQSVEYKLEPMISLFQE